MPAHASAETGGPPARIVRVRTGLAGCLALLLAVGSIVAAGATRPPTRNDEFAVIATFLIHFAKLTNWPEPTSGNRKPFVVGVVGTDPFRATLDEAFRGETVRNRTFLVKRLGLADDPKTCDMLFLGGLGSEQAKSTLTSVAGHPVLTLSASEEFGKLGAMVVFGMEKGKVVFEIDRAAVARGGLTMHSRLLNLGRNREEPGKSEP